MPTIPDRDIWLAANLLMRQLGADAEIHAANRADLMVERDEFDRQIFWRRVRHAIAEWRTMPMRPPH